MTLALATNRKLILGWRSEALAAPLAEIHEIVRKSDL